MSVACKCERCGKFYEPNQDDEAYVPTGANFLTFNTITLNHKNYENDSLNWIGFSRIDICPACAHSFTKWWTNPDVAFNGSDE